MLRYHAIKNSLASRILGTPLFGIAQRLTDWRWRFRSWCKGSFAQHGEDRFILDYFLTGYVGTYVDVGANHPYKISNTFLLYKRKWRGVTIEPLPSLVALHEKLRPGDIQLNIAVGESPAELEFYELFPSALSTFDWESVKAQVETGEAILLTTRLVSIRTLAQVCQTYLEGKSVDVVSIDAEGYELPILRGIDWSILHPQLFFLETGGERQDLDAIRSELSSAGYREMTVLGANTVFERICDRSGRIPNN